MRFRKTRIRQLDLVVLQPIARGGYQKSVAAFRFALQRGLLGRVKRIEIERVQPGKPAAEVMVVGTDAVLFLTDGFEAGVNTVGSHAIEWVLEESGILVRHEIRNPECWAGHANRMVFGESDETL